MRSDKLKNHNCPLNRKKEEIERRREKRPVIEVPVLPGMEAIPRLMQILEHYFGKGNLEKTISLLSNGDLVHGIITSEAYPECIKVIQRYTNQEVDCTYDNGKTVNHKHFVAVLEGSRNNKTIKNVCGVKWGRIKNIEHVVNVAKYIQNMENVNNTMPRDVNLNIILYLNPLRVTPLSEIKSLNASMS